MEQWTIYNNRAVGTDNRLTDLSRRAGLVETGREGRRLTGTEIRLALATVGDERVDLAGLGHVRAFTVATLPP